MINMYFNDFGSEFILTFIYSFKEDTKYTSLFMLIDEASNILINKVTLYWIIG